MRKNSRAHLFKGVTETIGTISAIVGDEFVVKFENGTSVNVCPDVDLSPDDTSKVRVGAAVTWVHSREWSHDGKQNKLSEWHFETNTPAKRGQKASK